MRNLLAVFIFSSASLAHAGTAINFTHAKGPHAVGLRVVQQYDHARGVFPNINAFGETKGGARSRPVQALVWYPAQGAAGSPMKAIDYELTKLTDYNFDVSAADILKTRTLWLGAQDATERARPMWAVRDAPVATGKYPVVIYAPGFAGRAYENVDLGEYLASHGYIVIASRSTGPRTALMSDDLEGLQAQASDIAFLSAYAHTLPQADSSQLAVVGYSWGGLANVFASAASNQIKALVSLDGSVRSHAHFITAAGNVIPAAPQCRCCQSARGQCRSKRCNRKAATCRAATSIV